MKTPIRNILSSFTIGLLFATFGATSAFAADDDAAKLKELERAIGAPKEAGTPGKKVRTRAIVFDKEDQKQGAAAPEPAKSIKTTSSSDCSALPPDVKANAVDFAIQFKGGSASLSPSSTGTLTEIAKILSLSDRCVIVEGHTDSTGNASKNMALSRDRANSVVKFIAEKGGIDIKRIVPVGKGSTDTIKNLAPSDPKNRRVVFKVVAS